MTQSVGKKSDLPSLRQVAIAACFFLLLSIAFQLRGLSPDGLLSDASGLRQRGLWAETWPPNATSGMRADYVGYLAPYAHFVQREIREGRLPGWNPYVATGVPAAEIGAVGTLSSVHAAPSRSALRARFDIDGRHPHRDRWLRGAGAGLRRRPS